MYLGTDQQTIVTGNFVGLGTSGTDFSRNSIVIPANGTITGLRLNIRNNILTATDSITATIVISTDGGFTSSTVGTPLTITGPNNAVTQNPCAFITENIPVSACNLISVEITTSMIGLANGVAIDIILSI
ncbi:hypothetical protein [Clostridium saccharoperbutylacetonicum]